MNNRSLKFYRCLSGFIVLFLSNNALAQVTIDILDAAQIFARGVGATVTVSITCDSPFVSIDATASGVGGVLTERVGNSIAQGQGGASGLNISCDNLPHEVLIIVTTPFPNNGNKPFKPGPAIASFGGTVCGNILTAGGVELFTCESAESSQETIRLVNNNK